MGASIKVTGTAELEEKLDKLANNAPKAAAFAVYDAAAIVADTVNNKIKALHTGKETRDRIRLPIPEEKEMLIGSCGIARFTKDGSEVQTIVGIKEGYGTVRGRKKAYKQIANAINSGTSFMKKQPFFRIAAKQSKPAAQDAMVKTAIELLEDL